MTEKMYLLNSEKLSSNHELCFSDFSNIFISVDMALKTEKFAQGLAAKVFRIEVISVL